MPPNHLQKQLLPTLWDKTYVCSAQRAAAVKNIALLSSALSAMRVGRETFQLCQPVAVTAGRQIGVGHHATCLSHTSVLDCDRAGLSKAPWCLI